MMQDGLGAIGIAMTPVLTNTVIRFDIPAQNHKKDKTAAKI